MCSNCTFMVSVCFPQAGRYRSATSQMPLVGSDFLYSYQPPGQECGHHLEERFHSENPNRVIVAQFGRKAGGKQRYPSSELKKRAKTTHKQRVGGSLNPRFPT